MANYIKSEVLCEAYSHLDIDLFSKPEELEKLKASMLSFFEERAKFLFGNDVKVVLEFEDGSLKTKIIVIGELVTVLSAAIVGANEGYDFVQKLNKPTPVLEQKAQTPEEVGKHRDFRQEIHNLSTDASLLAQSGNLEMIFKTKTAQCNRISIEKRTGIFGRVDEHLYELDRIKYNVRDSRLPRTGNDIAEFNSYTDKLVTWNANVEKLFGKLDSNATKLCIAAGLYQELLSLPDEAPWTDELNGSGFKADIIKADPDRAGKIQAASIRWKQTNKSIQNNFKTFLENNQTKNS